MPEPVDLAEHGQALKDLFRCGQCRSPLTRQGQDLVCPQNEAGPAASCATTPANADSLIRSVMGRFVRRLMNDQVTQALVEEVQRELRRQDQPNSQFDLRTGRSMLSETVPAEQESAAAWLSNGQNIKRTATDPRTYLDYVEPQEARELLGFFVEEILVGPNSAEIVYLLPMPDDDNRPVITRDHVPLQQ